MNETLLALSEAERLARLNHEARDRSFPNVRPVDAATLIVLDRQGATPRVLMGKRHEKHKFMPGLFVFPGGRAERADTAIPASSELTPETQARLMARVARGTQARARRLALAAIRETFEETGLVIGQPVESARAGNTGWAEFLATGFVPDLAALRFLARAITPPRRPKRFDTRFFVVEAEAIRHKAGDVVGPDSELTELAWLSLAQTATLPLPAITRAILADLHAALEAGWPDKPAPVPFYYEERRAFRRDLIG
ncbi:MAG: NUDIX hydrolase [Proteobacteria bacterium]|nr:NUDIX hydrolase [Pseudomonadota bacterium]